MSMSMKGWLCDKRDLSEKVIREHHQSIYHYSVENLSLFIISVKLKVQDHKESYVENRVCELEDIEELKEVHVGLCSTLTEIQTEKKWLR